MYRLFGDVERILHGIAHRKSDVKRTLEGQRHGVEQHRLHTHAHHVRDPRIDEGLAGGLAVTRRHKDEPHRPGPRV